MTAIRRTPSSRATSTWFRSPRLCGTHPEHVKNLTKDDFRLTDNGRRQTIRYFPRVSDLSLTVALLVETSRSMLPILAEEALATRQFFAQVLRPGDDSAEVLDFDSLIDVLQPFTSSREEL